MRIYQMCATFGKLEHETLTLEPGLNVITAPNEWGKSTWCAFLMAMFYGLDTRAKTTKTNLADKERYAPWSGSLMAGRIDLNWNGRDITIERTTRRRIPMGEFKAYETASGLVIEELTAANCGQVLLGVEQEVFRRSGFVRHADLPVTQDEALRRRLNALVTTGDDSGAADRLAASLKELKNRCRYNRTGLLPQAEAQRETLENKLEELSNLETQVGKLQVRLEELQDWSRKLENHQQALRFGQMESDMLLVEQARQGLYQKQQELHRLEETCAALPEEQIARQTLAQLCEFQEEWNTVHRDLRTAPPKPDIPDMPAPFTGMSVESAAAMAKKDMTAYESASKSGLSIVMLILGIFGIASGGVLLYVEAVLFAIGAGITGLIALIWGLLEGSLNRRKVKQLRKKYGSSDSKRWIEPVVAYDTMLRDCRAAMKEYAATAEELDTRLMVLRRRGEKLCGEESLETLIARWQQVVSRWEELETLRRETQIASDHVGNLNAMLRGVEKPAMADALTYSREETQRLLSECDSEQQRLHNRMGQYQGRMTILGSRESLRQELEKVEQRIARLEDTYAALLIAQETLADARAELQRRFAPRITRKAQEYLSRMTGGRYHSLAMSEDFSLRAGAGNEETLHDALWRSDGTIDQLYLALRLAVAQELTPDAPLILDDVFVRFDDARMTSAVGLLKEMSQTKQILCFTCQGREAQV